MQVSDTLIAAQQAAREARARLQAPPQTPQSPAPAFAAALQETGFAPLPLKQTAPQAQAQASPQPADNPAPNARPGSLLDVTI